MGRALGPILVLLMLPTMSSAEMSAARLSMDLDLVDRGPEPAVVLVKEALTSAFPCSTGKP
jgi:hypothetical protein